MITDGDDQDAIVNFSLNDAVAKGGNSPAGNAFLFTGRRRDEEVYGQYYYRARYLDWEMGRFLGREALYANLPLYAYANDDPVTFLDAYGYAHVLPIPPGFPPDDPTHGAYHPLNYSAKCRGNTPCDVIPYNLCILSFMLVDHLAFDVKRLAACEQPAHIDIEIPELLSAIRTCADEFKKRCQKPTPSPEPRDKPPIIVLPQPKPLPVRPPLIIPVPLPVITPQPLPAPPPLRSPPPIRPPAFVPAPVPAPAFPIPFFIMPGIFRELFDPDYKPEPFA